MSDEEGHKWLEGLKEGDEVAIAWNDGTVQKQTVSGVTSRTIYLGNRSTFHARDGRSYRGTIRPANEDDRLCWKFRNAIYAAGHGHSLPIAKVRKLLAILEEKEGQE